MDWRCDPRRPADFRSSKIVPRGDMTVEQFEQAYELKTGAGKLGLILDVSESQHGYTDAHPDFDPAYRETAQLICSWDWGTGPRKLVTGILLVVPLPDGRIGVFVDRVIAWGRVPFYDPTFTNRDTVLDRVHGILVTEYGLIERRPGSVFHTGDSSGKSRESSQLHRVDMMERWQPPRWEEKTAMEMQTSAELYSWQEQRKIVNPKDDSAPEVLDVNRDPWKMKIIEETTQPWLNTGKLKIHTERAAEAIEAAEEWGWAVPPDLPEGEILRLNKAHHKMRKDGPSDICETVFLYGVHAASWWLAGQTGGRAPVPVQAEYAGPLGGGGGLAAAARL